MSTHNNRYRVRPVGNDDPDACFEIEATTGLDAAKHLASALGGEEGHADRLLEVWLAGAWVRYWCHAKIVTTTTYEVTRG